MDAPWGRPWGEEIGRQPFYVWEGFKSVPCTLTHITTIDMFGFFISDRKSWPGYSFHPLMQTDLLPYVYLLSIMWVSLVNTGQ